MPSSNPEPRDSIMELYKESDDMLLAGKFAELDDLFRRHLIFVQDTWPPFLVALLTVMKWTEHGLAASYEYKWRDKVRNQIVWQIKNDYGDEATEILRGLV